MKKYFLISCMIMSVFVVIPVFAAEGIATIRGTKDGSPVNGMARIIEKNEGIEVEIKMSNVSPGNHGFHIHEVGNCAEEGKAAGGHFNPEKVAHGYFPKDGMMHAHAGDMGNITVSSDGTGQVKEFLPCR